MMTEDGHSKAKKKGKMMEALARKYKERPLVRAIVIKIPVVGASIDAYFEYGRKTIKTEITRLQALSNLLCHYYNT